MEVEGEEKELKIIIISTNSTHQKQPVHKEGIYKWLVKT